MQIKNIYKKYFDYWIGHLYLPPKFFLKIKIKTNEKGISLISNRWFCSL